MTAAFSARRRADEFEALLSRGPDATLTDAEERRYAALLEVVAALDAVPEVAPRPEFTTSLRERLMAEADTALVSQPVVPSRLAMPAPTRSRHRRLGAIVGGAAILGSAATMAVAAQTALPGESLYGVKRGIEAAEVRLATDDAARGRTLLAQADTRLTELEALAAGEGGREELAPETLADFTRQSSDGVRSLLVSYETGGADGDAQAARDFTSTSLERLAALDGALPESARDQLVDAGRTITDLDAQVGSVCAACTGGITSVPDFLLTSAATEDLLPDGEGDGSDGADPQAAPLSGQDVSGIELPEVLAPGGQGTTPATPPPTSGTPSPTSGPSPTAPAPTKASTPVPTSVPTGPLDPVTTLVTPILDPLTSTVTNTTDQLASQLNAATGGAVGEVTDGVDQATGGLVGGLTGAVDGATGGTLGGATGGLLPGTRK